MKASAPGANPWAQPPQDNNELTRAFPGYLRQDALTASSSFPASPYPWTSFEVQLAEESVFIPNRLYHNVGMIKTERLSPIQHEIVDCILTRHHDGFVREARLRRIISRNHTWIPPFTITLLGEYVVQILEIIYGNIEVLDAALYARFLRGNPLFFEKIEQRVISYWSCYYRSIPRGEYVGFRLLDFFRAAMKSATP